jgi:hypothetical protein
MGEEDLGVDVLDVTDFYSLRAEVFLQDDKVKPFWKNVKREELPEEYMDKLKEILGDGNATVSEWR